MRLLDLQPKWWAEAGRHGQGVSFLCPHCVRLNSKDPARIGAAFQNPLDGGAPVRLSIETNLHNVHDLKIYDVPPGFHWKRTGDTFDGLTLHPSIDASASGHWHGFVSLGETSP